MNMEFVRMDPSLIREVMKVTGLSVKSKAVRKAIEEFLMEKKRKGLKGLAGKLHFYSQEDLARARKDG